jgi:hypothetical protein
MDMRNTEYGAIIFGVLDPGGNMVIISALK